MTEENNGTKQKEMTKEQIKEQIKQLKADIFDIIRQQEILNNQISQLQTLKIQKNQELQQLEASESPFHIE